MDAPADGQVDVPIELPSSRDADSLAEWVELVLFVGGFSSITRLNIRQRFPVGQQPDEAEIGLLFSEVRRRGTQAPKLYPFDVGEDENSIRVRDDVDASVYEFLLMLSIERAPYRQQTRYNEMNPSLELLAREALLALHPGGEALRFAWPSSDGRPEGFSEAVTWLAGRLGLGELNGTRNPDKKDGAVDVVAWKAFGDGRPGFAVILCQVTVEMTFENKAGRVPVPQWKTWIDFGADPTTALVIPFAVPIADERWETLRFADQIVLDRMRLCELLQDVDLTGWPEWTAMRGFVEKEKGLLFTPEEYEHTPQIARPKKAVVAAHSKAKVGWPEAPK